MIRSWNLIVGSGSSSVISRPSTRSRARASFGRAAAALGYTQSAVSQQIQTLERIVGERLLERPGGPRAVSLTEAGALLLRHAEAIIARLHAAQADMAALAQGHGGRAPDRHVPERRRARAPRRHAPLHGRVAARRARADRVPVGRGTAAARRTRRARPRLRDAAAARRPVRGRSSSCATRTCSLVPAEHELAGLPRASLAELGDLPLIGEPGLPEHALAEDELTATRASTVDVAFRSDDNGTVQGLVGAGFGAALVPLLTVEPPRRARPGARPRPRDPAPPHRARLAPRPPPLARRARVRRRRRRRVRRGGRPARSYARQRRSRRAPPRTARR